jgi:hypothetical protein
MMNQDVGDAINTLVLGPFIALAIGLLFFAVAKIYIILRPMGTDGPFVDAYNAIGGALSASYSLFQLTSSIETWVAIAVIGLAVYGFFISFIGGGRGGYRGR